MAIRNVVTRGYGPGATIGFVVTRGYSAGEAVAQVVAGGEYAVKSHGKGRKRRYFIELDGKRLYGNRVDLERILEARAKPPLVARAVPPPLSRQEPVPVAPAAAPLPEFQPVDLEAYRTAKAQADALRKAQENAAIALLLMS